MRYTEPDKPGAELESASAMEEKLLRENQDLRRELQDLKTPARRPSHAGPAQVWHPSSLTIWGIVLGLTILIVVAFFAGYIPVQNRKALIVNEAREQEQAIPRVDVVEVAPSSQASELELPGNIQAINEAPILARADGYLLRRMVDIGDRVKTGQTVALI
jgi:hypothetical protein